MSRVDVVYEAKEICPVCGDDNIVATNKYERECLWCGFKGKRSKFIQDLTEEKK